MAVKQILCHCHKMPGCKLCGGTGKYDYDPGDAGYVPFKCPTCEGQRQLTDDDGTVHSCKTCKGEGMVDPAFPPPHGMLDVLTKILFGA